MRIGVSPYGSDRGAALAIADAAVAGGVDALWLGDGIFRRPDFEDWRGGLEALVELAWIAGRYPGVRVGVTAAVLPIRDIDWLIRQATTLDVITEGRFVLAVAAGFWADELAYRGVDPDRRGEVFRERLSQLRDGLGGDRLSPVPFTDGGPPLWLAGAAPTMRLAASLGLPYQASRALPEEVAPVLTSWRSSGGGLFAHRVYVEVGSSVPDGIEVDRHVLAGSPDQILAGLRAYQTLGIEDLSLVLGHDDLSGEQTLATLLSDVLPGLGEAEAGAA